MTMRGSPRRARPQVAVAARAFRWDLATLATLEHSTLPWGEEHAATTLLEARLLGSRDRLSLVGQFAAHQAFLQFAGLADSSFDPAHWVVVHKRGTEVRLLRVAAAASDPSTAPPVLTLIQDLASQLGVELEVLRQSWGRADAVYAEVFSKITRDVAGDTTWLRAAACGAIRSPTIDGMRWLTREEGCFAYSDATCVDSVQRYAALDPATPVITIRGSSPLERYSALGVFGADAEASARIVAERMLAATSSTRHMFVVTNEAMIDAPSREVVQIVTRAGHGVWITPSDGVPLPASQEFLIAPRLRARSNVVHPPHEFVKSRSFTAYLTHGEAPQPEASFADPGEPTRSYLGALALLGTRIPVEVAQRFLEQFLFHGPLSSLAIPGITSIDQQALSFASDSIREQAARILPASSRPAISRVAAVESQGVTAALLWLEAGEPGRGIELLEAVHFSSPFEIVAALRRVSSSLLSPALAARYAHALIDVGRYRDACAVLPHDEFVRARAERRTGHYESALARLAEDDPSFERQLLRAELLRLLERPAEATATLDICRWATEEEHERLNFERALLGADVALSDPYLSARRLVYRALESDEFERAAAAAADAHAHARNVTDAIDASLDRVYAAFAAGRWDDARSLAVEALQEIDETQGDRAAGGILFLLAYLAADDGQWTHAETRIARLRHFYTLTRDSIRLEELHLLTAHLDFSRGRFADARRSAQTVWETQRSNAQIREAAALILDELDWMEGSSAPRRASGRSGNVELARRRRSLLAGVPTRTSPVASELAAFRIAIHDHDDATATALAKKHALHYDPAPEPTEVELRMLRAAATLAFPFAPYDFEPAWCFATRNRLGHWNLIGSYTPPNPDPDSADWIECSERERLYVEGCSQWSGEGRSAISALFRTRAENHRLHRLLEQEEQSTTPVSAGIDGIIGQSPQIREIESLVARIARRDVPVCVLGDSGTGKELIARALHRQSARRPKAFTAVNCAALPETLIESELFGHVRGAFTGADRDRAGLIETTDGGTLFLDEIGELPLPAQAKLLRFLQEGEFRRVGDVTNRSSDVRIVSATNRHLDTAVEEGKFREDLYYRIRGVEIALPPLRERGADVLLLASHFLAAEREKHRGGPTSFTADVEAIFTAHSWPGNVRELQNTIRGAHAMAGDAKTITIVHLPEALRKVVPARATAGSYQDAVLRFKRELIERSLTQSRGNQNRAAAALKMSRQALAYQIRELGILVRA
jgi:DNA-binding NtrC family response regulator